MSVSDRRRGPWRAAGLSLPLALSVLLTACAPTAVQAPPLEPAARTREAGELIASLTERQERFRSLRALARVDYAGPDGKGSVQEVVAVQRPDHLRLETLTMLGAVLIVTVDERQIIAHHTREGVFVSGGRSRENLVRYTQIPLEIGEITSLLMGLPPVDRAGPVRQEAKALVFSGNNVSDIVGFESGLAVPTHWQRVNVDGEVELSAQFSDYVSTDEGPFPLTIRLEDRRRGRRVAIRYEEPEINVALSEALFSQEKPPHAKEVPIEEIGG